MELLVTVDEHDGEWQGARGSVSTLFSRIEMQTEGTVAVICGPTEMLGPLAHELLNRGVPRGQIFVSLERKMSCGVGKCGHCSFGSKRICIDGPVLSWWDVLNLGEEI
jgi:NAD(P)H-flavin reductase